MHVGLLTGPFSDKSLDWIIGFAKKNGFGALEVVAGPGGKHLDTAKLPAEKAKQINAALKSAGIRISSLAYYSNLLEPDAKTRTARVEAMESVIDAAAALGVGVVCTLAGFPMPGKDRTQTIDEDYPGVFRPLAKYAAKKKIKIAFENYFATNIRSLADWEQVFSVVPDENMGLNYDPSHLLHQGIDYLEAVERFKDRIFHTHAKDTEVKQHVLRWVGNQSRGWWRYVIPGFGEVNWGVYIARLRSIGYDDVLSIEHEDGAFGGEEGFIKGQRYLSQFV
ncbi:MAG: sugar phosphate isomerase/epimerase [Armatimonadota bacterium]|jgi:sugar phosphate isomerase/epimerase